MKKLLTILVIIGIFVGGYKLLSKPPASTLGTTDYSNPNLILFWGNGCPHCEKVKEYILTNKLDSKIKINYKEVYYDKNNQKLLEETVKKCPEIDSSQGIGVPLAISTSNQKCLYGDQAIIDWLNTQ